MIRKFWMTLALICLFGVGAKGAVRVMTISGESFSLTAETATGNGSYFYRFQGCNATATYSEASGCTVTFNGESTITGIRSTKAVKVILDKLAVVEVVPASGESGCSISADGGVEIVGPGRLSILNGRILSSSDIKIAESIVDIVTPDKVRPISTSGTIEIVLSSVSITGYGCLISGMEGVKITASMVSLLSWPTSEGSQYAVIRHGNPQVGKPGGVSITGSVVSIVGRDTETAGILTRRGLLITESCLAIVSDGPCISVVHFQDGGMQYFNHVRLFAVSQNGNAFADGLTGETNYAYWGDGKYVLCAASEEKAAMEAKTVEIDEGDIELCSPQNYGVVAHTFLMKDGSFKMSGKLNKKLLREEILAESAVEGVLTASLGWTSVQSEILLNMLANLDAALTTDVSGDAVSAVMTQEFAQTGGRMEQGDSACGHLAVDQYMARTKNGKTPAFTGGVFDGLFLMDYDVADPHPLVNAPTNALGQTLTHVEYEPYWVYLNGGVTPTECKVVFNANGGQCSTTSRQIAKGAEIGTLPTATWSGYVFDGWYTAVSGGTKVTATTKVTGDVTLYAHWASSPSGTGDVSVTSVTAQKRYPWNGLVDITVTIQGTAEDVAEVGCSFAAQNGATGASIPVAHITRNGEDAGSGTTWTRRFVWDVKADVGSVKIDDVALTVGVKTFGGVQLWENGPYWAGCNVGATKPEEYGYYFWWGDTVGYMWEDREILDENSSYVTWVSSLGVRLDRGESPFYTACSTYGKNAEELQALGYIDSTGNLVAAHDAATAHLGASWRMPTDAEFSALINNCTTTWTTCNGVSGQLVTGKGAYSSKSIFLPAAGYGRGSSFFNLGSDGYCRSATPEGDREAWYLYFYSGHFFQTTYCGRYDGMPVRPVRETAPPSAATGGVTTHFSLNCREVTITFNAQGGTPTPLAITLNEGSEYGELPTVTRPGYTFDGWYTAASGGTKVTVTTKATGDATLYAHWMKVDETPIATYGPWGEAEAVKNPDKLGPTMLTDMTLELNGAVGAVGDVVAAFRGDTGALCGLGKVMDESGTLSMVCYAPTGVKLHFKVWVAASGVEEPVVVDCDAKSDLTAPTSGAFLSGHALVVSDDKDLTISLGSADWHTVSFNVLPEDPSPAAVFGSVKAKIAAVTQGIEFWMPGKSSSLKAIEIGKGYWVNTKADNVEWTVSGKTDPKAEIALEEGWNLVGYAPEAEGAVQAVLKTALAAKAVDYVTYGVEFYPGGTLKKMEPGKAYWVHAKKAYTLVYDDGAAGVRALPLRAGALNAAAVPTYGPWGESEAVKNPDKLGPTFLTDMAVEIDGEPAAYGDVVAVFRGDTGALCGLGKVMDDSGTLTVVCYAPKGVTLSFKVWLSESGVEEAVVVKCDNASKLIAPESGDFYDGHAISGSTAELIETIVPGEKVEIDTGLIGYTASGLPSGLKYNKTTGLITGSASKLTAAEGVVVKFTKKDAEDEELTIVVRAEEISAGCEELSSGPLPAGVAGAVGGMDIQIDSEGGTKSVSVTKLPSGMKYDSKTGKITGAPAKAGEYEVVLTVTTKYGNKKTEKISVSVAAMPVMAVGKFDGFVSVGGDNLGTFTLTTTDAGKLTAKVVTAAGTVSFSGTCWDAVEKGVYRATLTTKKGEKLTLTLDSTAAWDANQLTGSYSSASGRALDVTAQKNAFGKTWYFSAVGDESTGWKLAYIEDTKGAALTVTLKADGAVSIAGTLQGTKDAKGKATTFKVSASGYANVCGLKDGAILADFAPILTVNKVKTVLAITTNLWFDRKNEVGRDVGQAKFAE